MNRLFLLLCFCILGEQLSAQSLTKRTYEGTLNAKIPVILTLAEDGDAVFGTVVYKKKGVPIRLVGSTTEGNLFLQELLRDGTVTGIFSLEPKGTGWTGTWRAPKRDSKELSVSLKETIKTPVSPKPLPTLTGTYAYSFGEEAGSGLLKVVQNSPAKITISVDAVTGAPAYNMATIRKTTLALKGNKAVYKNDEFGTCALLFTFGENAVRIDYMKGAYECGFGHSASASGNYVRTNAGTPTFEEPQR